MFDAIAARYDFLNHLLSAGLDRHWRARAIAALRLTGNELVLDLCTGTGDLAIAAMRGRRGRARRVLGVDFSSEMLRIGREKVGRERLANAIALVRGDATQIPVADGAVDAAMIAFGIRNVVEPGRACAEINRVLRPGGRLAILEFSLPRTPLLRRVYLWYFRHVLPRIGRLVSRHRDAYSYLPASVGTFVPPEEFVRLVAAHGFSDLRSVPLSFGIVYLYTARKSG